MKRVYSLLYFLTFLTTFSLFFASEQSLPFPPDLMRYHLPAGPGLYPQLPYAPQESPNYSDHTQNIESLYLQQQATETIASCYRTTGSISVPSAPSRSHYGHQRNRSKSLESSEIYETKIAALEAQLSSTEQALLRSNAGYHKETRDGATQTGSESEHEQLALIILEKIAALETVCDDHQDEYAALFESYAKLKTSASAPSGLASFIPGAKKIAAARHSRKTKKFDDETHKLGTSQQEVIDAASLTIQWNLQEVLKALTLIEQRIEKMHREALAAITKKTKQ